MKYVHLFSPIIIIIVVWAFLARALFGPWFLPTHDGEYHIIRFMEFYRVLSSGVLIPRWAPTLNSGFGIPIFIFHYPFPNYVSALLHIFGMEFVDTLKISMALAYLVASVGCFYFLRRYFSRFSSVLGTITMMSVPYWFVDMLVRGSVGEVWAIAWLFVGLASLAWDRKAVFSFALALLVLSHNILALFFVPVIVLIIVLQKKKDYVYWLLAGIGMSAFFWLPALYEQRFVVGLNTVNFHDHFAALYELLVPSWGSEFSAGSGFGNKMSLQIGVGPLLLILLALVVLTKEKNKCMKQMVAAIILGVSGIVFLMLPYSTFIWERLGFLQYAQYPWRFLSFVIPATAWSAAYVFSKVPRKLSVGIILFCMGIIIPYTQGVRYARRDDFYYQSRRNFTDGTSSMGNSFSTIWTPWKQTRAESPITTPDFVAVTQVKKQPTSITARIETPKEARLTINTLYYPGWTVSIDGRRNTIENTPDGLLGITIPQGIHTIRIYFGETPLRLFADLVSLCSLWFIIIISIRKIVLKNQTI